MKRARANNGGGSRAGRQLVVDVRRDREALGGLVRQMSQARHSLEQMRDYTSAQRDVVQANKRFSELYDFLPIPYLLLDHRGVVQRVNESCTKLFGLTRAACLNRPLVAFFSRDSVRSIVAALLRSDHGARQDWSFDARVSTPSASPRVRTTWRRLEDDEGKVEYHVAIVDLTESEELQEKTRRAEKEREESQEGERLAREASLAKDKFLATLSHELRTPLTPILSAVDSLSHLSMPGEVDAVLQVIRRNVRAEARLIDDLLDVARITQNKLLLKRRPIDLHETVLATVEDWRPTLEGAGVQLTVDLLASSHRVSGDAVRLGQVCRNLLSNAAKFTDAGGRIAVRSQDCADGVAFTVEDTGIGMQPGHADSVFEPFVQVADDPRRRAGLGLGLVICRGIVEAHEGTIRAHSDGPGRGTSVTVKLPTVSEPLETVAESVPVEAERDRAAAASDAEPREAIHGDSHPRVLLLEDHKDSAEMLSSLLTTEGYEVVVARSRREGLARLADCDFVISDIGLPDGSGLEFMEEARGRRVALRGIALSGYGSEQDVQRSLDAGFAEHLTKPVDIDRLIDALRRLVPPA